MIEVHQTPEEIALLPARICQNHQIPFENINEINEGGHTTFRVDDTCIIKIFTMRASLEYSMRKESQILRSLAQHTDVPVPTVRATGTVDGLNYFVLSIVPGEKLHVVIARLSEKERHELLFDVGRVLRQFHDHRPSLEECPDFDDIDGTSSGWLQMLERRKISVTKFLLESECKWASSFEDFADRTLGTMDSKLVLVHGDMQSAHTIVAREETGWRVSGIIDVPKVSMGMPEYDLCLLPDCIGWKHASLMSIILEAYGLRSAIDEPFAITMLLNLILLRPKYAASSLDSVIAEGIAVGDYAGLANNLYILDTQRVSWHSPFHAPPFDKSSCLPAVASAKVGGLPTRPPKL
jgi:aminoglycoside phosphotransferase